MTPMGLHALWQVNPIHRRYDVETGVFRIVGAYHTRILVLLAIELVIRAIEGIFTIGLECQLDNQLTIDLFDAVCKALVQIPLCLLDFSVA